MAGSVNKVILVGHLGRDPEIRTTQAGAKSANLTVATSESWTDRTSGEKRERTEWHRVVIFNERTVEVAERFLRKGRKVYLEGQLQTRKWTDQQGVERFTTEVVLTRFGGDLVLIDSQRDGDTSPHQSQPPARSQYSTNSQRSMSDVGSNQAPLDEEIPF